MAWLYLAINALLLTLAGILGWGSRRLRPRPYAVCLAAAAALLVFRSYLHAHPEHEQVLLGLSDDYVYLAGWDAPLAVWMVFALAARLQNARFRRCVCWALALAGPLFAFDSLALCFQPDYTMPARFDQAGVCRQGTDYSCGPAAAVTVARAAGKTISEGEMASLCLLRPRKGVTALELCRALNIALRPTRQRATIRRLRPDQIDGVRLPFLAEVRRGGASEHCVVVLEVRAGKLIVGDPAQGRYSTSREDFLSDWTGLAITVEPLSPRALSRR